MRTPALLAGITILDLGIWRPAPFASQLLAELGAAVTKVEPPGGDPMQVFPALYGSLNDRKHTIERDLKDEHDRADVLATIADVDVVIEGFRPGVVERLGVHYAAARAVNPTIVYCSLSGYGQSGPLADHAGHDLNYQAWTGFLAARAPETSRPGVPVGDLAGGAYAAMAICAAIAGRDRSGRGCHIDVSMADVLLSWAAPDIGGALASGDDPGAGFPAYGTFACADGQVTLGVVTEQPFWVALCRVLQREDLSGFDAAARAERGPELRAIVADRLRTLQRDDVVRSLIDAGVPVAPVLSAAEASRAEPFLLRGVTAVDDDDNVVLHHPVQFISD